MIMDFTVRGRHVISWRWWVCIVNEYVCLGKNFYYNMANNRMNVSIITKPIYMCDIQLRRCRTYVIANAEFLPETKWGVTVKINVLNYFYFLLRRFKTYPANYLLKQIEMEHFSHLTSSYYMTSETAAIE